MSYTVIFCNIWPETVEKNRTRLVVDGNSTNYPDKVDTHSTFCSDQSATNSTSLRAYKRTASKSTEELKTMTN